MADYQTILNIDVKQGMSSKSKYSSYPLRIHPFFQKQSVWEKMPIINDSKSRRKYSDRLVDL
jgi:hypothetical protein